MKLAIIGGGMAGLTAGILVHYNDKFKIDKKDISVDIYERQDNCGKKIALTGNGKCNLANSFFSKDNYYSTEENCDLFDSIFEDYSINFNIDKVREFYKSLGILFWIKDGYIYPSTRQAKTVSDKLILINKNLRNKLILNSYISEISFLDNKYIINNTSYDKVIFATGGMAGSYRENEFNGFKLLKYLGIKVNRLYPGLTRIIADDNYNKKLSGLRVMANASLFFNDSCIMKEEGELQFTDKGISGIPIFQLSLPLGKIIDESGKNNINKPYIKIDLLKDYSKDELLKVIKDINYNNKNTGRDYITSLFSGIINTKIVDYFFDLIDKKNSTDNQIIIEKIIDYCKNYIINIDKLDSFKASQVSTGGVSLNTLDKNFESIDYKGLYFSGELVDFTGKCGGYNLYFALYSAYKVSRSIREYVSVK